MGAAYGCAPCCAAEGGRPVFGGADNGDVEKASIPDLVLPQSSRDDALKVCDSARKDTGIKKKFRLKGLIDSAAVKAEQRQSIAFVVLCCDDGLGQVENVQLETDDTLRIWTVCTGVTESDLRSGENSLSDAATKSITDAVAKAKGEAKARNLEISGVTGDRPLWLKHQPQIRDAIGDDQIAVYMSTLIQLPMITAAFKGFEKVVIVTFGAAAEFETWKAEVLMSSGISVTNMDRLIVMGAKDLGGEWANFQVGHTTPEQEETLGQQLLEAVNKLIAEHNTEGKVDQLVKAVLLSPKISPFSSLLRKEIGMPVFDELTLLKFFGGARGLSRYSEANRLNSLKKNLGGGLQGKVADRFKESMAIGLIRLEYDYPPALGDMDHPGTWGFRVVPRTVKGLRFEVAQAGSMDETVLANMAAMIKELEDDEGVVGITGNCGFMMFYQCYARYIAKVPVFMSSLVQAQSVAAGLKPEEKVLILTANSETLAPGKDKMLRDSGIVVTDSEKYVIEGLQDLPGFEAVANAERVDTILVTKNITERVLQIIERERPTGAIRTVLFECTELPHYSDAIREATKLPVFDSVTVVNFFFSAVEAKDWGTGAFAAHNPAFWAKNFNKKGERQTEGALFGGKT